MHITHDLRDFSEFEYLSTPIRTLTATQAVTSIIGKGTVFLNYQLDGEWLQTRLYPVYYMPNCSARLLSLGMFLQDGLQVRASAQHISLHEPGARKPLFRFEPQHQDSTTFTLVAEAGENVQNIYVNVNMVDYSTMHRRFAHPSKDVLAKAKEHTSGFPGKVEFPKDSPICRGCAQGKMHSKSFPPSNYRAKEPFELIHSDLKSFPVDSYHKYKYYILYYDDYTSHAWTVNLRKKSAAVTATRQFLAMVKTKYGKRVKKWMSDAGGEYVSDAFKTMLKDDGIEILQSSPHTPQENGRAERFNRTLMDKAEAMRHDACLPPSWWEFAVDHAVHVYNRTPIRRLKWLTPYEMIHGKPPSVEHLRVFGCGAYVLIPKDVRNNGLSPKSELMIYLGGDGSSERGGGWLFMRAPDNVLFRSSTALFDETMFPKCPETNRRGTTRVWPPREDMLDQAGQPKSTPQEGLDDDDNDSHPGHHQSQKRNGHHHDDDGEQHDAPNDPVPPPQPPVEQPAPPVEPRRSGRERKPVTRRGNVYGEQRMPTDIIKDIEKQGRWKEMTGQGKGSSQAKPGPSRQQKQVPGPSSAPQPPASDIPVESAPSDEDAAEHAELLLAKLCWEGGVQFIERSQVWLKAILVNEPKGLSSEGRLVSAHQGERVGTMH